MREAYVLVWALVFLVFLSSCSEPTIVENPGQIDGVGGTLTGCEDLVQRTNDLLYLDAIAQNKTVKGATVQERGVVLTDEYVVLLKAAIDSCQSPPVSMEVTPVKEGYSCLDHISYYECDSKTDGNGDGVCDPNGGETCIRVYDTGEEKVKNSETDWQKAKVLEVTR